MNILLLAGGNSSENQVSLNSSKAIYEALARLGHSVLAIDPSDGRLLIGQDGSFNNLLPDNRSSSPVANPERAVSLALGSPDLKDIDVVVIGLHGGEGENGTIQSLFELAGIKYTGSGMAASAIAMNKALTKRLMLTENVPTPDFQLFKYRCEKDEPGMVKAVREKFKFPFIVKPNDGGSTVGLTKVKSEADIIPALRLSAKESPNILVEAFVPGRELTVAVLDGEPLPVVEIRPKNELYDYQAKYTKGMSEYIAPAPIDPDAAKRMQADAVKVFNVIGASGLTRIDFILTDAGNYYCLEINTLPGMTNLSLAPMAAKVAGMDFDMLIDRIIKSALAK